MQCTIRNRRYKMAIKSVKATINGQEYTLTLNSGTGKYEATITAPSTSSFNENDNHYYPVEVKVTDMADNVTTKNDTDPTLGDSLKLVVKEKVAPIIEIISPTQGQLTPQNKPQVTFKVTDNDSGVNLTSVKLKIDNVEVSGLQNSSIEDGYQFTYTPSEPLDDGEHTVTVNASDNDGNAAEPETVTFNVLATAPNLSVDSPTNNIWTNNTTVAYSGTTDGATLTVKVNEGQAQTVDISGGSFSGNITLTEEGANTLTFVATSAAGIKTTVTRTVNLDTKPPVIASVSITPNPVDAGSTYVLAVEITD
ncbi:Ig-like domain-containing protein [Coprobacillaceae bacterium CR2/5/TPMF4]|nr:Ig-like domain-containing protein [Coprobacillaceae bacterium CR2/5/TPMF4]